MLGHLHQQSQHGCRRNRRRRRLKARAANPVIFHNRFHIPGVLLFEYNYLECKFFKKCEKLCGFWLKERPSISGRITR